MGWFADRRQARLEQETEQRLRRLIYHVKGTADFYIPGEWVAILGHYRVNVILAEFGLPPARPESRREAA